MDGAGDWKAAAESAHSARAKARASGRNMVSDGLGGREEEAEKRDGLWARRAGLRSSAGVELQRAHTRGDRDPDGRGTPTAELGKCARRTCAARQRSP